MTFKKTKRIKRINKSFDPTKAKAGILGLTFPQKIDMQKIEFFLF